MEDLGKRLETLRKENKMSQKEVADALFVTPQAISRWEKGKTEPDAKTIVELSKLYGVDASEILEGKKTEKNKFNKMSIWYLATSIFMIGFSAFALIEALVKNNFVISIIFVVVALLYCTFIIVAETIKAKANKKKNRI